MAGLSLGSGAFGGNVPQGAVPRQANVSAGAPTIAQKAFGIQSANQTFGPRTAAYGTTLLAIAGAAVLVFLWHSLPR